MNARVPDTTRAEAFEAVELPAASAFEQVLKRPASAAAAALPSAAVATLHGFDLQDRPLVRGIAALPGEVVVARSTVALRHAMQGAAVVLVFESGDARLPIVLGVVAASPVVQTGAGEAASASIDANTERLVLQAEREVVLQCGDASITLTRAGKVLIRGHYILSRASGYNRIKGAAIDIN